MADYEGIEPICTGVFLGKQDLESMQIAMCPSCGHITLQAYTDIYKGCVCLTCGLDPTSQEAFAIHEKRVKEEGEEKKAFEEFKESRAKAQSVA